jgi:hypothetical protein
VNAAAVVWTVALPVATFQASRPHASISMTPADAIALAVYTAGGVICHQRPERSLQLWSTPMPVCARCTGIYAGAAMAVAVLVMSRRAESMIATTRTRKGRGADCSRTGVATLSVRSDVVRRALYAAAVPTVTTLAFEWSTGHVPANWVRLAAGIPLGSAVAWAIGSVLDVK